MVPVVVTLRVLYVREVCRLMAVAALYEDSPYSGVSGIRHARLGPVQRTKCRCCRWRPHDSVPRCDRAILVRTAEDVVRHAVLDAARHIDLFRLGADPPVQMILNEPAAIRPAVESEFPTGVPGQF